MTLTPDSTSPAADPGSVVVIGAGPAGLTAAYQLGKAGHPCTVLEATDVVGGISQTVVRDGWRFDIGGHRFFTKVPEVEALWHEILPDEDFMQRPRSSRIYYQGKFYDYPLQAVAGAPQPRAHRGRSAAALSFLWVRIRPPKDQSTLEGYVVANYGWRLYGHFFKTYSEKVWAVPPSEISADWGAQRIKGMSLWTAVWEPLRARFAGQRGKGQQVTSLIEEFQYPKLGPGMMWERCQELVEEQGSKVVFDAPVTRIAHARRPGHRRSSPAAPPTRPTTSSRRCRSTPCSRAMDPPVPGRGAAAADDARTSATSSRSRSSCPPTRSRGPTTGSTSTTPRSRPCGCRTSGRGRRTWCSDGRNVLGLEYTVHEGDEWWTASDDELIEKGKAELEALGLMHAADVEAGYVVRMPKAYPVYDEDYQANVEVLRALARRARAQRAPGRPQRDAQVQQPGPLDVHRHAHRREHPRRLPRHLGGQRRGGVPRGGRRLQRARRHRARRADPRPKRS